MFLINIQIQKCTAGSPLDVNHKISFSGDASQSYAIELPHFFKKNQV